jgi:hypothetical protein
MIGFLFGLAVGTAIGFLLGCVAAIGAKTGREADRVFRPSDHGVEVLPFVNVRPSDAPPSGGLPPPEYRKAAGVRVCSCIGRIAQGYPRYINPDCPFHGGAA